MNHQKSRAPPKKITQRRRHVPTKSAQSNAFFVPQMIESGICRDHQLDKYWKIKRQVWMILWSLLLQIGCAEFGGKVGVIKISVNSKKMWLNIPPRAASNVHSSCLLLWETLLLPSVSVKVDPNLLLPSIFCKDLWMVRWIVFSKVWSSCIFSGHGREGSVLPPKRIIWSFAIGWAKAGSKSLIPRQRWLR